MSRSAALLALAVAFLAAGCPNVETPPPDVPPQPRAAEPVVWRLSKSGLGFRLSDIDPRDDRPPPQPKTTPLSDADVAQVIARLPPIQTEKDDEKSFALRDKSKPPPRTGKTVSEPFPPPAPRAVPVVGAGGPLAVTRKAPVGDVALAPALDVSFSAPMVAITSHDDLAKTPPPVTLTPTPPGKWRWAGAQTAIFDPEKRFPMATDYTVEVPAGTRAAGGQTLATAERWTFSTPPPKIVQSYPHQTNVALDPVMYVELDQAIDAAAVLRMVQVTAGATHVEVRAATEDEIQADNHVRVVSDKAQAGRWLALKATASLSPGTSYVVRLPPGVPSAEGPKRTTKEQTFTFHTYDPLHIERIWCGWRSCPPNAPWSVHLNNPLDMSKFDRAFVKVSPEPESLKIDASGSYITIRPRSRGKTKYTITLSGALADVFGQTLGKDASGDISVDPADPYLFSEESEMSVLDPGGSAVLPIFSVNRPSLDVRLYAVGPDDMAKYHAWREAWDREEKTPAPPGKLVSTRVVRPASKPDELTVTPVDLTPALHEGLGQVLVIVEPTGPAPKHRWERQWVRTWVQVTKIGLTTFTDLDSMVAWTSRLADGAPLAGVDVALQGTRAAAASGADGLARLALDGSGWMVTAKKGPDLALLPERYNGQGLFQPHAPGDDLRWFVFDDRGMYKPGEEMRVKGWLRVNDPRKGGDIRAVPAAAGRTVRWTITDASNVELGKGQSTVDANGGFDLGFKLPGTPNLGYATIAFKLEGSLGLHGEETSHSFQIQEFRRPEFEVSAHPGEGPFYVGGHTDVAVDATYYAGGGLPNAAVHWNVQRSDGRYVPPNRSSYAFGKAQDFWWLDRGKRNNTRHDTWEGRTNASGEHRVRVDFDALDPPYPMTLSFDASVTDVNRQAWSAHTDLLVHPARVYVGVRQDRAFVKAGEALSVDTIVTDIDGAAVPGRPVSMKMARIDWEYRQGEYTEVETDPATCDVVSTAESAHCSLKTGKGGRYKLTATVTDEHGRKNRTETHLWVLGDSIANDDTLQGGKVQIIPSKTSYGAGETAELLVLSPFAPAEGVLAVERQGIVHVERFRLESTSGTVHFKVDPAWTPNVVAAVSLAGASPREDARGVPDPKLSKKPAFATGATSLQIPPTDRKIDVKVTPREAKIEPGGATVVEVDLRDGAGAPVAGTAAVVVVDEAVLALSGYPTPDPLGTFYATRPSDTSELGLRERVLVARAEDKHLQSAEKESPKKKNGHGRTEMMFDGAPGGGGGLMLRSAAPAKPMASASPAAPPPPVTIAEAKAGDKPGEGKESSPIKVRKDLTALAVFSPAVATDARGHASIEVKLPDSLTRYRVMAVAVAGERQFGSAEASITARLPLMVRPSAPRFLNYGDTFELPVVLQNQTNAPLEVDMAARAANALLTAGAGRRVTVPANDRVEVRLPAAAQKPGKARFQVGAASGHWADAAEIDLPVWTPATTEAFATYGTIDDGAVAQPVKMPSAVEPSFGGLEITTSSTAVSALTDAVLYLIRYPFECNEQISSRVMSVAALRDVLSAFNTKDMPSPKQLEASMAEDIEKLRARQHWSGGWDFWSSDREPWPYLSVHVAHALSRAKDKGYAVPQQTLDRARGYLRNIESHIPAFYSPEARRSIVAYALYTRKRLGEPDPAKARSLIAEGGGADKTPLDMLGWLWPTISEDPASSTELAELRRHVQNRVTETAGAAHFATAYKDGAYVLLDSDRRADAVLLEAMIGDQPKSDLIPKVVTGLLAHKKAGRWSSTQENAFVLLALDRYFGTYEKATPDFVARAWLGDRFAGEHVFKGRTTERSQIDIPMRVLAELGQGDVVVGKDGPGRLYYRIGMTYAPSDLRPPPAEHGFTVSRQYEAVDAPADVRRADDGVWHVKAGAKVRVRLTMVVPARRYHVALVDPLPAGLEVMNPALAVTGNVPHDPHSEPAAGVPWWWSRTWYEHQNLRDERVEAFSSLVWDGVYDYTYVARATTPGSFVVPPPKAEEMYSPETFGRGAGDRLVVE